MWKKIERNSGAILVIATIALVVIGVATIGIMLWVESGTDSITTRIVSPDGVRGPFVLRFDGGEICTDSSGVFSPPDECPCGTLITVWDVGGRGLGTVRMPTLNARTNLIRYVPFTSRADLGVGTSSP